MIFFALTYFSLAELKLFAPGTAIELKHPPLGIDLTSTTSSTFGKYPLSMLWQILIHSANPPMQKHGTIGRVDYYLEGTPVRGDIIDPYIGLTLVVTVPSFCILMSRLGGTPILYSTVLH